MNSMTGFGKSEGKIGETFVSIEVRSVNHRYLDVRSRLPHHLTSLEIPLTQYLRTQFERGSFDITLKSQLPAKGEAQAMGGTRFAVDDVALNSFVQSLESIKKQLKLSEPISLSSIVASNRIVVPVEESVDMEAMLSKIRPILKKALDHLKEMRANEGKQIERTLSEELGKLKKISEKLAELAPGQPQLVRQKLTERIKEWAVSSSVDPNRLEWEVAFYAERSDVAEEVQRLGAHIKECLDLIASNKAVGRRLDFLAQELHREINTLGAKTSMMEMTQLTLDAKAIIEKLREQAQNVE